MPIQKRHRKPIYIRKTRRALNRPPRARTVVADGRGDALGQLRRGHLDPVELLELRAEVDVRGRYRREHGRGHLRRHRRRASVRVDLAGAVRGHLRDHLLRAGRPVILPHPALERSDISVFTSVFTLLRVHTENPYRDRT